MPEKQLPTTNGHAVEYPAAQPSSQSSFADLVDRLRAGDDAAAARVFQRFSRRLVAQAQSALDSVVRQKVDPEDVIQSVFKSFFQRQREGQFQLENWDSLWGILTLITLRKCRNRFEYFHAARRDVRREESLECAEASQAGLEVLATDPTPEEAAALNETLEELMRGMEPRDREMLALQLQGYTMPEISDQIGWSERTVRRSLERARKRLQRMRESEGGE